MATIKKTVAATLLSFALTLVNCAENIPQTPLAVTKFQQTFAHKYTKSANDPDTQRKLAGLMLGAEEEIIVSRAQEILNEDLNALSAEQYNISSQCAIDLEIYLAAFQRGLGDENDWAFRMIDAMGKPSSNLLDFQLVWLGSYDECVAIKPTLYNNITGEVEPAFSTQYCLVGFSVIPPSKLNPQGTNLAIGTCNPDSCTELDVAILANRTATMLLPTFSFPVEFANCQARDKEYSGKAIAVLTICAVFVALMAAATFYDMVIVRGLLSCLWNGDADTGLGLGSNNVRLSEEDTPLLKADKPRENGMLGSNSVEYKPGTLGQVLLSFSVYTNTKKILSTSQPSGALTAVNGIRFISMTWVILGHTYSTGLTLTDNLAEFYPKMISRFTFQAISNASFSVDTFFVLSGLLVSYLTLKEIRKCGGVLKFKWWMYYFHRFWRLTPPYMLVMLVEVGLLYHMGSGPYWFKDGTDKCEENWWQNLLYINNFYTQREQCFPWGWYLANDMQFYVISPLLLVPLFFSPVFGGLCCLAVLLTNFITSGVVSKHYELLANILADTNPEHFDQLYIKPWHRIGPYMVGLFTGYALYKCNGKIRIPKILNAVSWLLATTAAILIVYGLHTSDGSQKLSVNMAALYNATSRTAWGMCVAWVIFACATGYGGPVNAILSWSALVPLSRLTYCAYLVHPIVISVYYMSRRTLMHWYDLEMVHLFGGNLCLAYGVAFVTSLAFESPMMGLEKALLGRGKKS